MRGGCEEGARWHRGAAVSLRQPALSFPLAYVKAKKPNSNLLFSRSHFKSCLECCWVVTGAPTSIYTPTVWGCDGEMMDGE